MDFKTFSLFDSEIIKEIEKEFGSDVSLGFTANEWEGIINFPIIHNAGAKSSAKVSYTVVKRPHIPVHSHEKTQHVYACMDGEMTVDVLFDSKAYLPFTLRAFEGCYIPAGIPHTLDAEYAILLCVEVPPDTNDFKVYGVL